MKESAAINNVIEPVRGDQSEDVVSDHDSFPPRTTTELNHASSSSLADLLGYHDKEFVLNLYAVIASRQPALEELSKTLEELRSGRRTKTEVVEELVDLHPGVRIDGMNSPLVRKLRRVPFIGYCFSMLRAITRLPVLVQHQQQFESFIVGQHRSMADYFEESLTPYISTVQGDPEDNQTIADSVKTVMMLSDSLIELSASFAETENRLRNMEGRQENDVSELRSSLITLTETLQHHQQQTTIAIQRIQEQWEKSGAQVNSTLVSLTAELQVHQQQLQELRTSHQSTTAAQREFLVNEQRAIVEAERAAVDDLQLQLDRTSVETKSVIAEIQEELCQLRSAIEDFQRSEFQK